ncbi:MAG: NADH-quinone oxidoreductase subunit J [Propionibacteriaceae bacterium]|jgi:NADH-quinone oxidoreductase subunit J|nr:NADH-quinone oxidoreductase subunit J [Propionibacteriaceae bacterium]
MILLVTGVNITFWICAVLAIAGAVGLVVSSKPVYSALWLALVMVSLAVIYASLNAPFLFAVQIIVYTGAVLMLFLFVIMLVGVDAKDSFVDGLRGHRVASAIVGLGVLALLILAVVQGVITAPVGLDAANADGNVEGIAAILFSKYVIAFEATAALLITAAVAAMVLAHPERLKPKVSQTEKAQARLDAYAATGAHPGPRPNSGIFARHNSIATPALLPDGSIAEKSVSKVLADRVAIASADDLWAPHDEVLMAMEGEDLLEIEDVLDAENDDDIEVEVVEVTEVDSVEGDDGTFDAGAEPESPPDTGTETESEVEAESEAETEPEDEPAAEATEESEDKEGGDNE